MSNTSSQPNETLEAPEPKDRRFNAYRRPKTSKAQNIVDEAIRLVENYENILKPRKRKRKARYQEVFEQSITAVICDLMHHTLINEGGGVAVTRSKRLLGANSRYRPDVLGKPFPALLDSLAAPELGLVNMAMGYQGFTRKDNKQSIILAGQKLKQRMKEHSVSLDDVTYSTEQETIYLRGLVKEADTKPKLIEYADTEATDTHRRQMQDINAWLRDEVLEFDPDASSKEVDASDRLLKRIFTNGSFESGGRLFGGFWQTLSKRERREGLTIGGLSVVTLDYRQMTPRILYGLVGQEPDMEDLYSIPGYEGHRKGVKKVLNAMTFAEKPLTRMPQETKQLFPEKTSFKMVEKVVLKVHEPIAQHFYTGIGHRLQFIESQIMTDVLLTLMEEEITALPIHDAVIVSEGSEDVVSEVMVEAFRKHTGIAGLVEVER